MLALWNETQIWDRANGKPVTHPPARISIDFGASVRHVDVYDPLVSAEPQASHRDVRQLPVDVPDHVILLEITPADTPGT